jgi:phosphotransferase system enzyme I (PtsI)
LAPADTATLDPAQVLGVVTREGGATSHTAILARALGIPAVVGLAQADGLEDGADVLLDGARGTVVVDPDDAVVARASARADKAAHLSFDGHGHTSDGHSVPLLANVGDVATAVEAARAGAEGVGLFRTEFLFLDRDQAPSIAEQTALYREVLQAFPGKKVVFRTLDAGADKPLPFLDAAQEPNPALGVRGYRTALTKADLLEDQLAAIAAAREGTTADVWVMAPLIATVDDAFGFRDACRRHDLPVSGVMVEVPSAALMAHEILGVSDFASIGTNDLSQYVMAADRMVTSLAGYNDPWQPAVLRMISLVAEAGEARGKPVGVCGEAAGMPALAVVLAGLGVTSLSMSKRALPAVSAVLAATSMPHARDLAAAALSAPTAHEARARVLEGLPILDELGI